MKKIPLPILLIACGLALVSCRNKSSSRTEYSTTGSVERLSPVMDEIFSKNALPEVIADSFIWSEGPLWLPEQEMLIFSDVPENTVYQWNEIDGLNIYLKPSGYTGELVRSGESGSNGLHLSPEGDLILCQHGDRRIGRMEASPGHPEPNYSTLSDNWDGKRFNSPNDLVISRKGDIYFTDPAYGMELKWKDPKREIDFAGVYHLSPNGQVSLLIDSIPAPNGIGLSPDETRLYIASSGKDRSWYEYRFAKDGILTEGRVAFRAEDLVGYKGNNPDGLVVRDDGIIFASGPGGVLVFDPDWNHLGTVMVEQKVSNCELGNGDNYLYFTADMFLIRIPLK
jgi:gluconolactonase